MPRYAKDDIGNLLGLILARKDQTFALHALFVRNVELIAFSLLQQLYNKNMSRFGML